MITYAVYLCFVSIIVRICQGYLMTISNKIMHCTNITREILQLHMSYKRTNYNTYTIFHKGVWIWNVLNEEIRNTKT